jgi:hypothetical protein
MTDDDTWSSWRARKWRNLALIPILLFAAIAAGAAGALLLFYVVRALGGWASDRLPLDSLIDWQRFTTRTWWEGAMAFLLIGVFGILSALPLYFQAKGADRKRILRELRLPVEAPPEVSCGYNGMPEVSWTDRYPTGESKEDASISWGWGLIVFATMLGGFFGFSIGGNLAAALFLAGLGFMIAWALRPHVLRQKLFLRPASPYEAAEFHDAACQAVIAEQEDKLLFVIFRRTEDHDKIFNLYRHPPIARVRWDDDHFSNFELRRYSDVFSRDGKVSQIRDDYAITIASDDGPVLIAHSGLEYAHIERLHRCLEKEFTGKKRAEFLEMWRKRSPRKPPGHEPHSDDPDIPKSF